MENKDAIYWEQRMLGWFDERSGKDVGGDVGNPGELIGRTIMFEKADSCSGVLPPGPWWGMIAEVYWSGTLLFIVPSLTTVFKDIYFCNPSIAPGQTKWLEAFATRGQSPWGYRIKGGARRDIVN